LLYEDALIRDSRWPGLGRVLYGVFAYPVLIAGLVGSISTGVLSSVVVVLAVLGTPILICEWRLRMMGFILESDCIVLVRPINRTRIPWSDIDSFAFVMPGGWIDYGNRRVGIRRQHGRMPRAVVKIPTVWVSARERASWVFPRGAAGLKWAGGEITDVMGFLNEQLVARRSDCAR
jgi:hypothetical protein